MNDATAKRNPITARIFVIEPPTGPRSAALKGLSHALPWWQITMQHRAPAAGTAFQRVRAAQQSIEQRGDRRGVTAELAPVVQRDFLTRRFRKR